MTPTIFGLCLGAYALAEYALGRWGGPRGRSLAQALATGARAVVAPTIGKLPVAGPIVIGVIEAVSPPVGQTCAACQGTGALPAAETVKPPAAP